MLYSPINYQGNKSRIVDKLLPYIPKGTTAIHEIFCGSAILSFASSVDNIHLNDTNHYILDLIEYFRTNTAEEIIKKTDSLISQYGLTNTYYEGRNNYIEEKHEGLSRYNKDAYNKLKDDYNKDKEVAKLFVLVIYGFNHFLRFNGKDEFNVPVGKVDFVESLRTRTIDYCKAVQNKKLKITNFDFRTPSLYETNNNNDLFYFDPPYLITQAPYNSFWNEKDEQELLDLLDILNAKGYKFLLSNVIESNGKENTLLKEWMKKYNVKHIKRQYLNSSYQKKNLSDADEVIIYNYSEEDMANNDSGRSGNRKGYKVFSINTTVRNPKRNMEFLHHFIPYADKEFDEGLSYQYFFDLVVDGVYRLSDIPEYVKKKIADGEKLTISEAKEAIKNNPQATGLHGRVMTQLRSMKDQGFLRFETVKRGVYKIHITTLGQELLDEKTDATLIYTKAMIGMHAHSPIRVQLLNEARPFLNMIFVINEVKKQWEALGNEAKGILRHEFAAFVLSMKDCDYQKAANDIINYRKKFKYELNMPYIRQYLIDNDILPLAEESIKSDYPDDVFRKFEMTGLIIKRGAFGYTYYDFSAYNIEKIESILSVYKGYKSETFATEVDYYDYLSKIEIPWQKDDIVRKKIVESKEKLLAQNGFTMNQELSLDEKEKSLDRFFYNMNLQKAADKYDIKLLNKELLILAGVVRDKSKFEEISEPLRLEYLLALLIGKKYGTAGLVSNIIYNEEGEPLHFAPSGKCDIVYHHTDGSFIFEPTMQRGKNQILNNETANIARHVKEQTQETGIKYRAMMIAPYVHPDVADFFRYKINQLKVNIAPININRMVGLVDDSDKVKELGENFDTIVADLLNLDEQAYSDKINGYIPSKTSYTLI